MAKQVVSHQGQDGSVHAYTTEEKRAFANHINDILKDDIELHGILPMNPESDDLFSIISRGVLLCKMLNKVTPATVPEAKINTKTPLNQFEVNAMHGLALAGAKSIGCQVVNIGADDLSDGTPHLILGLVWQIVRIDLMNRVKEGMKTMAVKLAPQDDPNNFLNVAPEQNLLRWFNFHLRRAGSPLQVTNFGADLRSSEAYIMLFTQVAPQCADVSALSEPDLMKRAQLMLDMAGRANCRKFVQPADVVAGNTKLNLAFTSYIFLTCPGVLDIDAAEAAERRAAEEAIARQRAIEDEARMRIAREEEARRKAEADAAAWRAAAEEEARRAAWNAYYANQAAAAAAMYPPPQAPAVPQDPNSPGPGEVWLFKDGKYFGQCWKLTDSNPNFERGMKKEVSSMKVGPGVTAILYSDPNYQGSSLEFNTDAFTFGSSWNDRASSIKIIKGVPFPRSPGPGEVYIYRDSQFQSHVWRINDSIPNLGTLGAKKMISSVKLGPNTQCVLYDSPNYSGKALHLERDADRLGDFNDEAVSIKIFKSP